MHIPLDHHSGEPIYRQIVEAIKYRIASGQLAAESQLPSIRDLARALVVNPRTVIKAYEELQQDGVVVLRHGRGVFVTEPRSTLPVRERRRKLEELARRMLSEAACLGAGPEEVLDVLRSTIGKMEAS
jgi:GntR family transcriptional regulator